MSADRPKIFVASSSEQQQVMDRICDRLASPDEWVLLPWTQAFAFSATYIESLEHALDACDFAVVVMTGDDPGQVRGKDAVLPRDNVIFELGLFIGRLGRDRCAFVVDVASGTTIASDLSGVKAVTFRPHGQPEPHNVPGLGKRLDALKEQIRAQLQADGLRYRPDEKQREQQQARWRFLQGIAGLWWERMRTGDDDSSALSRIDIRLDPITNSVVLDGTAYGLNDEELARWNGSAQLDLHPEPAGMPTLTYAWRGHHRGRAAFTLGGTGSIEFDGAEAPASAHGSYYDTPLSAVGIGQAPTREKQFRLWRFDADDLAAMADPTSATAKACVKRRRESLTWP